MALTKVKPDVLDIPHSKNLIINGAFDIWQRGSGPFTTDGGFYADRWTAHSDGAFTINRLPVATTIQRAAEFKAACGHSPKYFVSFQSTTFNTYTSLGRTRIEGVYWASGKTLTLSVPIATENGNDINVSVRVWNTSSNKAQTIVLPAKATTDVVQRLEWTFTIADVLSVGNTPDETGFVEVEIFTHGTGWHDFACIQLEEGPVATPFEYRPPVVELPLCQRYFEKSYDLDVAPGTINLYGTEAYDLIGKLGSENRMGIRFKTPKRTAPSITLYSPNTGTPGNVYAQPDGDVSALIWHVGRKGFLISFTPSAGAFIHAHWVADAEL